MNIDEIQLRISRTIDTAMKIRAGRNYADLSEHEKGLVMMCNKEIWRLTSMTPWRDVIEEPLDPDSLGKSLNKIREVFGKRP